MFRRHCRWTSLLVLGITAALAHAAEATTAMNLDGGIVAGAADTASGGGYSARVMVGAVAADSASGGGYVAVAGPPEFRSTTGGAVGVEPSLAEGIDLGLPFPNPVRGEVSIHLSLPAAAHVRFDIHDALGRRVHAADADLAAGRHALRWDGRDREAPVAPGTYFVKFTVDDNVLPPRRFTVVR